MRTLLSCTLLAALCCPLGADDKQEEKIDAKKLVGKWERQEKEKHPGTVQFTKDGKSISIHMEGDKEVRVEGTYKLDGNKLTVEFEVDGAKRKELLGIKKLTDTEMVVIVTGVKEVTMVRVKDR